MTLRRKARLTRYLWIAALACLPSAGARADGVVIPACYLVDAAMNGRNLSEERATMLQQAGLWNAAASQKGIDPAVAVEISRRLSLLQADILRLRNLSRGADANDPANRPRYDWYVPPQTSGPADPVDTASAGKVSRPVQRTTEFFDNEAYGKNRQDLSAQTGALKAGDSVMFGAYVERGFTVPAAFRRPAQVAPEFVNLYDRETGRMVGSLQTSGGLGSTARGSGYVIEMSIILNTAYAGPTTFKALLDPVLAKWRQRGIRTQLSLKAEFPTTNSSSVPGADALLAALKAAGFNETPVVDTRRYRNANRTLRQFDLFVEP